MKYIIVCPEKGVFVGIALGLTFWSGLDTAGQDSVPVCDTEEEAKELRDRIGEHNANIVAVDLPDHAACMSAIGCTQLGYPWVDDPEEE